MSQPDQEPALQHFHDFIDKNYLRCDLSKTDEAVPDAPEQFLPPSISKDYFSDRKRLNAVLRAVLPSQGPPPADPITIAQHCCTVFAILLRIKKGRFIARFLRYENLYDKKLPFDERPRSFPLDPTDPTFFDSFYKAQWPFCTPTLTYARLKEWEQGRILPFISKEKLGGGGSAITYKVELEPQCNHLDEEHHRYPHVEQPRQHPTSNTFILKTFKDEADWQREVEAFVRVRNSITGKKEPNIVKFYGSYKHRGKFNVILEYANEGTLEDFFHSYPPPSTGPHIYQFWESLIQLIRALGALMQMVIEESIHQGWHQDVKPKNILVCRDPEKSIYECTFKLADLGLSHFRVKDGDAVQGWDARGTRTYGAPESHRADEVSANSPLSISPLVDIWSLGCVFSEAAVWSVHGMLGLQAYRKRRREETDLEDSDCFHDGEDALECVIDTHRNLHGNLRVCDKLTPGILHIIGWMLEPCRERLDAHRLYIKATKTLKSSESMLRPLQHGTPSTSLPSISSPSTSQIFPRQQTAEHPPQHVLAKDFNNIDMTPNSSWSKSKRPVLEQGYHETLSRSENLLSPGRTAVPHETHNYNQHLNEQWQSGRNSNKMMHDPLHGQGFHEPPGLPNLPVAFNRVSTSMASQAYRDVSETNHISHSRSTSSSGIEVYRTSTASLSTSPVEPRSINAVVENENEVIVPIDRTSREEKHSSYDYERSIPIGRSLHIPNRSTMGGGSFHPQDHSLNKASSTRTQTSLSSSALRSQVLSNGALQNAEKPPFLSVSDAHTWRERRRAGRWGKLPNEDLKTNLNNRDHVFILDNSAPMRHHWNEVVSLVDTLAYIVKECDPNGMEIYLTVGSEKAEGKHSSRLRQFAAHHRPPQLGLDERRSNIHHRLSDILETYKTKLETQHTRHWSSRILWGSGFKDGGIRKMSIYIFTDGAWWPKSDAEGPIKSLIETLDQFKLPRDQVGIQFLQFGKDQRGRERLERLDLLKITEGLSRDIIDHEPVLNGNVWKMLLGAIDEWFDGDPETLAPSRAPQLDAAGRMDTSTKFLPLN